MPVVDASPQREIIAGDFGLITAGRPADTAVNTAIPPYTWAEVTAKASSSSVFGDIPVGLAFMSPVSVTPASGDMHKPLTEQVIGFARGWNIELARTTIDTTALKDQQSTSIFGRPTAGGNINGFLVTNDAQADEAIRRFMDTYKIAADGSVSSIKQSTEPLTFIGYTLKQAANKAFIEAYYLPKMDIGTLNVGSEVGGLTDFNSPLALRSGRIARYFITLP